MTAKAGCRWPSSLAPPFLIVRRTKMPSILQLSFTYSFRAFSAERTVSGSM